MQPLCEIRLKTGNLGVCRYEPSFPELRTPALRRLRCDQSHEQSLQPMSVLHGIIDQVVGLACSSLVPADGSVSLYVLYEPICDRGRCRGPATPDSGSSWPDDNQLAAGITIAITGAVGGNYRCCWANAHCSGVEDRAIKVINWVRVGLLDAWPRSVRKGTVGAVAFMVIHAILPLFHPVPIPPPLECAEELSRLEDLFRAELHLASHAWGDDMI